MSAPGTGLSLADVEGYVRFRAFDVIGNGAYRRYVNACKEKDEPWAVDISRCVLDVGSAVRTIQTYVADLQDSKKSGLHVLCNTVMENNTPPIDQTTVIAECCVSKKPKCQCIVLKCKGRGAPSITVQSRFGHFVLMLWTVFKMDVVIKTVTRDFIDSVQDSDDASMKSLCDQFNDNSENVQ
eukprot:3434172-Rhodomonas_salina.1